jgi:hypothetical protein
MRPVPGSTMPGATTPMPSHFPVSAAVGVEQALDGAGEDGDESPRLPRRRDADDVGARPAHRVGHHQIGPADADVDGHARALARVDVEQRRPAAARGLAGGAFDDVPRVEQVLDDEPHGAAAQLHAAREVGARDRLMAPDQRQRESDG